MSGPPAKAPKDELAKLFQKQEKYLLEMDYKKVICSSFFKPKIDYFICTILPNGNVGNVEDFIPVADVNNPRHIIENYYNTQINNIKDTFNNILGTNIDRKINLFNRIKDNSTQGYKAYKRTDNSGVLFYHEIYCSYVLNDLDIASVFTQFDSYYTKMSATKSPVPPNEVNYNIRKKRIDPTNIVGTNILPIWLTHNANFTGNSVTINKRFNEDNRQKISDRLVNSDKNNNIIFESYDKDIFSETIDFNTTLLKKCSTIYNINELHSGNKLVIHNDNNKNINVIKYQNIPNLLENNEYNNTFYNSFLINYLLDLSNHIHYPDTITKNYNLLEILRHNSNFENYENICTYIIGYLLNKLNVENLNTSRHNMINVFYNRDLHNNRRAYTGPNQQIICHQNMSNFGFIIKLLPNITINNAANLKAGTKTTTSLKYFFSNIASYACVYVDNNRRKIYSFCPGLRRPYSLIMKRLATTRGLQFGQNDPTNTNLSDIDYIYDRIQNDNVYLTYEQNRNTNRFDLINDFITKDNIYSNCANAYTVNPIENQNLLGEDSTTYSLNLTDFSLMYCNYFLAVMSGNIPDAKGVPIISYDDPFEAYFDEFFKTINHADFNNKGVIDKKKYTQHVEERCDFIGNLFYTDLGDHFSKNYKSKWNKDKPATP